jgi:hypothetical protein
MVGRMATAPIFSLTLIALPNFGSHSARGTIFMSRAHLIVTEQMVKPALGNHFTYSISSLPI